MGKIGNKKKKQSGTSNENQVDMVGPDNIQVLRGEVLGKQVALVLCGESHNEALDLTRPHAILEPKCGWVKLSGYGGGGWSNDDALRRKYGVTLGKAKDWAAEYVDNMEEEETVFLVYVPDGAKGTAYIYNEDAERSHEHTLADAASVFKWADLDTELREFNEFRLTGEDVDTQEHDMLVEKRKTDRRREGIELFDDWLEKHSQARDTGDENAIEVHLLLEQCPNPSELELHRATEIDDIPPAIESIRRLEEDSEPSEDEDDEPSAYGDCDYLDYLYRRCKSMLPLGRLHCVDMRCLGDEDAAIQADWNSLLTAEEVASGLSISNPEEAELKALGLPKLDEGDSDVLRRVLEKDDSGQYRDASGKLIPKFQEGDVVRDADNLLRDAVDWNRVDPGKCDLEAWGKPKAEKKTKQPTLPSFEGFFGQPANFLYYDRHLRACYAPFIARAVKSKASWDSFMKALFFGGTIPEALASLDLSKEARACSWVRSPICLNEAGVMTRRNDSDSISFRHLPISCYLKAKGSEPPRTWLSALHAGLASRTEKAAALASVARQWALDAIEHFAKDPKGNDDQENGGEWFVAWLRAAHREIYDDIDTSDESVLLGKQWMPSESQEGKKHRHQIGEIKIPSCQDGLSEVLKQFDIKKPSTRRAEVLAQIFIDVWMVKLVDYAAVLKILDVVEQCKTSKVVVACYFGSQHTRAIEQFWRTQGLSSKGLSANGYVGKPAFEEDEARRLELPSYLHDFQELFNMGSA